VSVKLLEFPKHHIPGPKELLPVTAIIWVVAYAGMELSRQFGRLPTIWPTDGIMVAILLGAEVRGWPAYILAGFAGNVGAMLMLQYPADLTLEFPFANFSGIIFIAVLLRQHVTVVSDLYKLHASLRFMFLAAGAAPLLAASLKVLLLYFDHINVSLGFFIADFLSHSLGLMTVTPFALALRGAGIVTFTRHRFWLALLMAPLLLGITVLVFAQPRYPLLFMVYPPLVLIVCLFRLPSGAFGLFAVTMISLAFTTAGHGPAALSGTQPLEHSILAQIFAGEAAVLVLGLAAVLGALDRSREQLSLAKETLALLADTDSLTGLANRRRLDAALQQECRRAARNQTCLALLMIDADNFKAYNDHYGHPAGDDCLRAISCTVAKFSTRPGDLTARYGGEELVVLLPETGQKAAFAKAEEIRMAVQSMALPHAGNADQGGVVTVSIGVSGYDPEISVADPHAILNWGDKLLYEAKRTGKNKSVSKPISSTHAIVPFTVD
jgi:diguanylate cyclase (GGDEF)-like protein